MLWDGVSKRCTFLTYWLPTNRNSDRGLGKKKLLCFGQLENIAWVFQQKRFCLHSFSARQKSMQQPFSVHRDWVGQTSHCKLYYFPFSEKKYKMHRENLPSTLAGSCSYMVIRVRLKFILLCRGIFCQNAFVSFAWKLKILRKDKLVLELGGKCCFQRLPYCRV